MILSVVAVAARRAHPAARRARRARRPGAGRHGPRRTPTAPPRAAGPAGPAPRCAAPAAPSPSASCCSAAARRPGARHAARACPAPGVVDPGHTSRDGYDMVVESFGPGAAGPAVRHRRRRRRRSRWSTIAAADRDVVDARIVAEPAATGRVVVRVTPGHRRRRRRPPPTWSSRSAAELDAAVPSATVGGPGAPEPRPHRRAHRPRPLRHRRSSWSWRSCCCSSCSAASSIARPSILMNLVSVGAAFGFATLVFQHGYGAVAARHRAPGLRRRLGTAVLLRPAVRPVDGLPAVPARRDQGALRGHRRHPAARSARASPAPAGRSPTPRSS